MGRRAVSSGVSLTERDAAIAKGMLARGDRQHDIAAYFGVNGGRIGELSTGAKYGWVKAAPPDQLPLAGPYPPPSVLLAEIAALQESASHKTPG